MQSTFLQRKALGHPCVNAQHQWCCCCYWPLHANCAAYCVGLLRPSCCLCVALQMAKQQGPGAAEDSY